MKRKLYQGLALALFVASTLTGCGGSGSSVPAVDTPTAVNGVVADGYLKGAIAFLDKDGTKDPTTAQNKNYTAFTNISGNFTLNITAADKAKYPIVVKVPKEAIDKDTGAPVGKEYVMSTPPGKPEFVSPITTLIHNKMENDPSLKVEDAKQQVHAQLGLTQDVDLFTDYVKNAGAKPEYHKVHNVARVVAASVRDNMDAIKTALGGKIDQAQLQAVITTIVNQVMTKLTDIASHPAINQNKAVDPTKLAAVIKDPTLAPKVDTANATALLTTINTFRPPVALSLKDIFTAGAYSFDSWKNMVSNISKVFYSYSFIKLNTDATALTETKTYWNNPSWTATAPTGATHDYSSYYLATAGWVLAKNDGPAGGTVNINADGTATWTRTADAATLQVTAVAVDISGRLIGDLEKNLPLAKGAVAFPADSKLIGLKLKRTSDSYRLEVWSGTDSAGNPVDYNFLSDYSTPGKPVKLTSLDQIATVFKAGSTNYLYLYSYGSTRLQMQFVDSTTVNILKPVSLPAMTSPTTAPPAPTLIGTATAGTKTVNGQTLLVITIPDGLKQQYGINHDKFFVVKDSVVKQGGYLKSGSFEKDSSRMYNEKAFNHIKSFFDTSVAKLAAQ